MKDKTYYLNIDGQVVRVRAEKEPNKETIDALSELVKAVRKKEIRYLKSKKYES